MLTGAGVVPSTSSVSVHQPSPLPRAPPVLVPPGVHARSDGSSPPARAAKQSLAVPSEQRDASTGQKKRDGEKHINLSTPVHPLVRDTIPGSRASPSSQQHLRLDLLALLGIGHSGFIVGSLSPLEWTQQSLGGLEGENRG